MNMQAFMIGVATAFFAIFSVHILYFRLERTRYQTVLGVVMAVWALWMGKDVIMTFPGMYTEDVLNWIMLIDGWSAIAYVVLIMEATRPGWTTRWRLLCLALPFAAFTLAYALWPRQGLIYAYVVYLWFFGWTVVVVAWVHVKRYIRFVSNNYSNIDGIDVSWLRPVFVFAIVSQLTWLFTSLYASATADVIYYVLTIAVWLAVLYYSWNFRPVIIDMEEKEMAKSVCYEVSPVDEMGLKRAIEDEQIFLDPDLTLATLAKAVGTNRTYMSNWLSDVQGQTFYNYVNRLRVERASIPLMNEHPEYTMDYIAEKSGFGSVSTFRRAFQKFTGQTPQTYKANSCK
ncbi:MAG: helix-turn-helix transcriptional regulator [Prevotella sp.]|nr:helix-turn-helix transcriptional regulator [Prevotella sp.]